jgi:hypothetical protein
MGKIASIAKTPWALSKLQRLFVLLCGLLFLVAYRPWASPNNSSAFTVYSGVAAIFVLALLPRGLKLVYAIIVALVCALAVLIVGDVVSMQS